MRKIIKVRLLAGILAAALMCTTMSQTAYAAEEENFAEIAPDEVPDEMTTYASSGNGIVDKLNELRGKYPNGKYWWRVDGVNSSVSDRECPSPDKDVYNGGVRVCSVRNVSNCGNYTNGVTCYQCVAFAYTLFNEIFGQNPANYLGNRTDKANIMVGDYVRLGIGHSAIVIGKSGSTLTLAESNFTGPCKIAWGRTCNVSEISGFCHATNYDQIVNPPQPFDRIKGEYMSTGYTRVIPDGYYHIASSFGDKWWLTVAAQSSDNGANVNLWDYSVRGFDYDEQLFYFQFIDEGGGRGFYKITSKKSGKCLDVLDASEYMYDTNGKPTNIQQYEDNGTAAQRWAIRQVDGGEKGILYTFKARCSGFCLDLYEGEASLKNGANISIHTENGTPAQLWRLVPYAPGIGRTIEDGEYQIACPAAENKALGAAENRNGGNIELSSSYKGDDRQVFDIKYLGDGYYSIVNKYSGHALEVAGASRALGTNVQLGQDKANDAQKWMIKSCGNGCYSVLSKCNVLYLNLENENAGAVNNVNMCNWSSDGTNQIWKFIPYEKPVEPDKPEQPDKPDVPEQPEKPDKPNEPETSDRGEVLEEDVPQGKVENIPQGLWMSEVVPQTYTGKAIKPEVRVYDYKTLLVEKRDYTISYKNNKNVSAPSGKNRPTITVAGRGNYIGKETQTFSILPKQLTDDDIIADNIAVSYNGKVQKPVPVVLWNGKKLARNRDYKVTYPQANREGIYEILLEGIGNYGGKRQIGLTITQRVPVSKLKIDKMKSQVYTGLSIMPTPVVKYGRNVLKQGADYTLSYQNNVEVGTAAVIITGKGDYVGEKRVTFKIVAGASLKNGKAELSFHHPVVYNGGEVRPDGYHLTVPVKNADGKRVILALTEGTDYQVTYKNNNRPGMATICFEGIGGYTGTLKKTYKISPYDIRESAENEGKICVEMSDSYAYTKGGCKPEPVVTFRGTALKKGTDYTLSYKNNTALNDGSDPSKLPMVKIKGRGCFTGEREVTYNIMAKNIGELTMTAADKVWQNKRNSYRTKVVIRDADGKALRAGTDYEKLLRYEYEADVIMPDGTLRKAGEEISEKDILLAGTKIWVTASAKGGNYTGTLAGSYRITKADIARARVTVPAQTYTGRQIRPDQEIQVKLNGKVLNEDNYVITGYANNINKGTATVTIRGKNDCGGLKTVKFRIKEKGFLWWWR